ncbi:hypothetical protein PHSY_001957 [Pseudozyma hubeiensis SY62]|uniref:EthD domain-containing protein n=1 Tax=Pseudozyma hubeiensis (strain SY62) TaxID=1305764 RepID=R9NZX4_PSEHS|nr:hypothetical protein PHSY_001957 [Pseudozyma hubeiensis SY62]GAC94386.1 hypothetical protein PHSY_001957 [Pseudozyma hubeiensis SY62]
MSTDTSSSSALPGKWEKLFKVSIYLKKKHDISDEKFSEYYAQSHAALAAPVLLRHKCVSYTQFHCMADKAKQPITAMFGPDALSPQNPMQVMPYDGCSTFVFAKLEDAQAFFHDPETTTVLGPDAVNFTDPSTLQIAIGQEFVAIKDGKAQHE